ncbi:hypothetical protein IFT90_15535 [Frigoribacterium sp. CFBP 8766]|uniref:hypothetical protein n=1 Tax=Frigoribacterium sp. CFBP 8766 TaxID=2775273 RepID=UPI0017875291|nr:hypothetical protein [Frigoribacterium sp. CFBP 8766]MBD8585967.1 hypothetical protein [Frigoribacterium sp. CFBP 8766]
MDQLPRLDDVWAARDYPVLMAVAKMLEEQDVLQSQEIATSSGQSQREVVLALTNLGHRHLVVKDASGFNERDNYVVGIRPEGLEAVGQWPSSDVAADRLIAALDALVDTSPIDSPKQNRLVAIRDGFATAGRDVLVDVAAAVISGRIPT